MPFLLAVLSALAPVVLWFFILKRKNRSGFWQRFLVTFFLSGFGAMFMLQFEPFFKNALESQGLSFLLIFMLFGVIVEYYKNFMVRIGGYRYFKNIDDVMDLSFAAALGFTFFENFFLFFEMFSGNLPDALGPVKMIKYFLTREFFILPIHLFTSGVFGYFYGVGLFAKQELREKNRRSSSFRFLEDILFFVPEERLFKAVKILQGTLISVFFYGLFFTILEQEPTTNTVVTFFGFSALPLEEKLLPLISFAFFKFGTIVLFSLMDKKRRWKRENMLKSG